MEYKYKAKNKKTGSIQTFSQHSWLSQIMGTGNWILLEKIVPNNTQKVNFKTAKPPKIKTGGCGCN